MNSPTTVSFKLVFGTTTELLHDGPTHTGVICEVVVLQRNHGMFVVAMYGNLSWSFSFHMIVAIERSQVPLERYDSLRA